MAKLVAGRLREVPDYVTRKDVGIMELGRGYGAGINFWSAVETY